MESVNYESISVNQLHFDPENPRLPPGVDGAADEAVLRWMLMDAGLVELMGSIAANGFFPAEPLLVTQAESGGYTVLEGNRRLAAVRLLLDPEQAPQRQVAVRAVAAEMIDRSSIQRLPCAIFDHREEVLDYLGFRHITGVKQWEPEAKARYMDALYRRHRESAGTDVYRFIARLIGSRSDYVSRLLASLRLHEQIVADEPLQETLSTDEVSFSLVTLALTYTTISKYLNIESLEDMDPEKVDHDNLRHLATWMFHEWPEVGRTQLGDSRNMKLLAQAISREEGMEALKRGDVVEDAAAATLNADELLLRALRQSRDRLLAAQGLIHRATISRATLSVLDEIESLLEQVGPLARRKVRRAERENV